MKKIPVFIVALLLSLSVMGNAQSNYTPSELDTLVSSIALYPDPLLVHVLTASTYGEQIPAANLWAQGHKHLTGESLAAAMEDANLNYDPSVQALIPFPTVLAMMAKYKPWCDQLGDAVTSQKEDVMEAVQRMRQSAYDHGHLKTDDKVQVSASESNIAIVPVKTEVVYVPVYNPRVVYYVYADGYTRISYGSGVWLGTWYGEWGWGSCWFDWGPRVIYVRNTRWYPHRYIPRHPRRYVPPPRRIGPPPPRHGPGMVPPPPRHHATAPAPRTNAPVPKVVNATPRPAPRPMNPEVREVGSFPVQMGHSSSPRTEPSYGQTYPAPAPSARSTYEENNRGSSNNSRSSNSGRSSGNSHTSGNFGKVGRR